MFNPSKKSGYDKDMNQLTQLLKSIDEGDAQAADQLMPLVYEELRKLAETRLAHEPPAVISNATSLVHDAYIRLVKPEDRAAFANRRHFFSAASEAMRRILIERARQRRAVKHGGGRQRLNFENCKLDDLLSSPQKSEEVLALDEALDALVKHDETAAELVKMRFFGGLGHQEAAEVLGLSRRQADGLWTVARAWLFQFLSNAD